MSPIHEELVKELRQTVIDHYQKGSTPLLLSILGSILRERNLWHGIGPDGKKLREIIEDAKDPNLLIVRDKNFPSYVAVTTESSKQVVEQMMERRKHSIATVPDLDALPRTVLLAFCVQEIEKRIFLRKSPPFRYQVGIPVEDERDQFLEIEDRYRRPGLDIMDIKKLTATDRLDLQAKIAAWSRDKGVTIESFYRGKKHANALERFLAAQSTGVAARIMIPADIALILSQHE